MLRAIRRGTDDAGSRRAYCVGKGNLLSSYHIPRPDVLDVSSRPSLRPLRDTFQDFGAAIRTTWAAEGAWRSWLIRLFAKACPPASTAPTSMQCMSVRNADSNHDVTDNRQRSYWTNIAREFPGTTVSIIVFDTPYQVSNLEPFLTPRISCDWQVCASRLENRKYF